MRVRRPIVALLSLFCAAASPYSYQAGSPPAYPPVTPEVVLGLGQSWMTNVFGCMGCYGFNPEPCCVFNLTLSNGNFPSGLVWTGAGSFLQAPPNGIGYFTAGMLGIGMYPGNAATRDSGSSLSILRSAALAHTYFRAERGKALTPIIQLADACPSSDWYTGPCGGLGTGLVDFTASIASGSNLLTVNSITSTTPGILQPNQVVIAANIPSTTTPGALQPCQLASPFSGTGTGGTGTYALTCNASALITNQPMYVTSYPWWSLQTQVAAVNSLTPTYRPTALNAAAYVSTIYVQGGDLTSSNVYTGTLAQLALVESSVDALDLPGAGTTGMEYYISPRGAVASWIVMTQQVAAQIAFIDANANGRTVGGNPWYQYALPGSDIHFGVFGTLELGEFFGYEMEVKEDEGVTPTPLRIDATTPLAVSGNAVTLHFDRPAGWGFASSSLEWMATADEGISIAAQYGFDFLDNGVEDPVTSVTLSGADAVFTLQNAPAHGDTLTYDYCWYGPGAPGGLGQSGVWGNLMMPGPASFFHAGLTLNAWAYPIPPTTYLVP